MSTPPPRPMAMDPLHITEFASDRYFTKFNQQQRQQQQQNNAASGSSTSESTTTTPASPQPLTTQLSSPFFLPLSATAKTAEAADERENVDLPELKQKKSRFHLGRLLHSKSQTAIPTTPSIPTPAPATTKSLSTLPDAPTSSKPFGVQFYNLPTELQIQIIASMPLADILQLRLSSRNMHAMVSANESPIVRHHLQHNVPAYAKRLYPPDYSKLDFRYLCGIWHRLHVAAKLSSFICQWVTKEIFLRTSEAQKLEFAPQNERMRRRLIPLLFTIFHFFETYRARHLQYIIDHDGKGLQQTPYTINPIEAEVMSMYDDRTLLQVHQVFPLVIASFCRRLRPPSYVGRVEKSLRGYMKDKPPDEVHVATLCIGGLRQVERFWEIKGYNVRRNAVDVWYNSVAKDPAESTGKPRRALLGLGRKMSSLAIRDDSSTSANTLAKSTSSVSGAERGSMDDATWERCNNLIFNTSLADGMPMDLLPREELRLLLSDLPVLQQLWLVTAEALILERKIVEKQSDIRRNAQVMLELIREDGFAEEDEWWYGQGAHDSIRPPLDSIEEDMTEDMTS
ncbi:uncharacterized protein SPSK_03219 [Sporothrix schenckii 1099-18]|uniref:F-box domain-containing protein n=1 Tax=Sporothrix schenckii 1099-18 TaxID=1397361 RepID=A0A0F2LYS1_SPOSC|nr:uncharacterized protein SPSK_03219 [Sporothrix schenckii 1099-18]KJR82617.1 hypothetical protein SPSK_03219 [Sporothrix schenckii 1099-18]